MCAVSPPGQNTLIAIVVASVAGILCFALGLYHYRAQWKSAIRAALRAWLADEMPGKPLKLRSHSTSFSKEPFGAADIEDSMKSSERVEMSASCASAYESTSETASERGAASNADEAKEHQPGALNSANNFGFYRDAKLIAEKVTRTAAPDYDDEVLVVEREHAPAVVADAADLVDTTTRTRRVRPRCIIQ